VSLADERRVLLAACMDWMRARFDRDAALLLHPRAARGHVVRESLWYAAGLLASDNDVPIARRIVDAVLELQFDEPDAAWDGTWPRTPQEPRPTAGAHIWRDYDPNWRQFIGCLLGVLAGDYGRSLGDARCERMHRAIARAIRGEGEGRIVAGYSNIALMHAWLLAEYGDPPTQRRGIELARAIDAGYCRDGGFGEFNSPTYYGVDAWGVALWRRSRTLADLGAVLEENLWRDVAMFHHGGLRNACGPYDRAYGLDMTRYAALLGLWVWWACGEAGRAFPDVSRPFGHALDVCAAPLIAVAPPTVSNEVVASLLDRAPQRSIVRRIGGRTVTATLTPDWMLGAVDRAAFDPNGQAMPVTAHWRNAAGGVGVLCVQGALGGAVDGATVEIYADAPLVLRWRASADDAFEARRWELGGRAIGIEGVSVAGVGVHADRGTATLTLTRGVGRLQLE
jgi:hypothetical protein